MTFVLLSFFFFFQAEDGIRDLTVTGVQTCALPILVSVGSTPTALAASRLDGVTEVRAGVYVFFDLVMRNIGVCTAEDVALSVLATVIGHQADKGWAIVDAGWMAMSRDRGTARQKQDRKSVVEGKR